MSGATSEPLPPQMRPQTAGGVFKPGRSKSGTVGENKRPGTASPASPARVSRGAVELEAVDSCPVCACVMRRYGEQIGERQSGRDSGTNGFLRLIQQDFCPKAEKDAAAVGVESAMCRFHQEASRRYQLLWRVRKHAMAKQRPAELYKEVAHMDTNAEAAMESFLNALQEVVSRRQQITLAEVRKALMGEAQTLVELWDAEAMDLDQRIEQGIVELQRRQDDNLFNEKNGIFKEIEKSYKDRKPHHSTNLLELFDAEPKMCKARAFNEALRVIDAGKVIERAEINTFRADLEREKSLKVSWKVCQQMRQFNGVVDKMQRHRRQKQAQRETDKGRLRLRVHAGMQRLERDQREELRKLRQYLQKHCFRIRKLVESAGQKHGVRTPLYESRSRMPFNRDPQAIQVEDNPQDAPGDADFQRLVLGAEGEQADAYHRDFADIGETLSTEPAGEPPSSTDMSRNVSLSAGAAMAPESRPKSAPSSQRLAHSSSAGRRTAGAVRCDWCGRRCLDACMLHAEGDAPSQILSAMCPYDFPVALSLGNLQVQAQAMPKPPKGSDSLPTTSELRNIAQQQATGKTSGFWPMDQKPLCFCCSWRCCRLWNQKNSPPYLRTRRDLGIDLKERASKGKELSGS